MLDLGTEAFLGDRKIEDDTPHGLVTLKAQHPPFSGLLSFYSSLPHQAVFTTTGNCRCSMCSSVNVEQDLPNSSPKTEGTVCWHLHLPAACDFFEYLLDVILDHSSESYSSSASELVIFPISKTNKPYLERYFTSRLHIYCVTSTYQWKGRQQSGEATKFVAK